MRFSQATTRAILILAAVFSTWSVSMGSAAAQASFTEQISVSETGAGGNAGSVGAAISADGRFVAFISGADNLVDGDDNAATDVFVRDREEGTTERIPLPAGVTDPSGPPSISGDGRFVVFAANGPELDVLNIITHVYLYDRATGLIEKISTAPANHGGSYAPVISTNGRVVAYFSLTYVPFNADGILDVLVYDRDTGQTSVANTSNGEVMSSLWDMDLGIGISGDGRIVAFTFGAALVPGAPGGQVFVHDMTSGNTIIASLSSSGTPGGGGFRPAVNADGRFVTFYSASALVSADTNGMPDTYVRDLLTQTVERVSVDSAGREVPLGSNLADSPAISGDGRFVAFASVDPTLTLGDTNGTFDVFVRDRLEGTTKRVSVATDGTLANGLSFGPALSADGGRIAFTSDATNLSSVKNTAANFDVYVREEATVPTKPILSAIVPSPSQLWPPNNKWIDVVLTYTATSEAGEPSCDVAVSSDEMVVGPGTRINAADWEIVTSHHVRLRAARTGGGSGRVYTITVSCVDGAGQTVSGSTRVTVPNDRGRR